MKLFHNPRCSKSRRAVEFFASHDINVEIVTYLKDGLSYEEAKEILEKYKGDFSDLLRNSSQLETNNLSKEQQICLLLDHVEHLQRPILLTKVECVIGRPIENFAQVPQLSTYFSLK
jgi:arsenate reductase